MSLDFLENNHRDDFDKYYSSNFASGSEEPSTDLASKENEAEEPSDEKNLYNPGRKKNKLSKKIINAVKKNKIVAVAGGGLGGGALILIILLFLGAQQLPGFAALIADINMAKDNQLFERDTTEITSEKAALDAEDPVNKASVESKYSDAGDTLSKLENYNPNETFDNLGDGSLMNFNYADGVLKDVDINGTDISQNSINPNQWAGTNDMENSLASSSSDTSVPELMNQIGSLDENGGLLVREGNAAQNIEALQGDALSGIEDSSDYANDTAEQSDILLDENAQSAIDPNALSTANLSETGILSSTEKDAIAKETTDATDSNAIEGIINNGGVDTKVESIIDSDITTSMNSVVNEAISKLDPLYLVGVPLCIIYDGSLASPQASTVTNTQNNEAESTYIFTESAADQEKSGDLSAQAVGAVNRKFGNLDRSVPEVNQSGGTTDTLSAVVSPQAGTGANYSTKISSSLTSLLGKTGVCGIITNQLLAATIITLLLFTQIEDLLSITTPAADAAATAAVDGVVDAAIDATIDNGEGAILSSVGEGATSVSAAQYISENGLGNYLSALSQKVSNYVEGSGGVKNVIVAGEKKIIKSTGTIAGVTGVTYGLTMLAHEAVEQNLGTTYNGYSEGTAFANQADEGGNALSNELVQKQYYGVPLSPAQVTYNKAANIAYLSSQNSSKSAYQRYLAISNPFSLLSRVATTTYADVTGFSLSSFFEKIASVFNPTKLASGLFSLFKGSRIYASSSSPTYDTTDYGITQWGYTSQEDALTNPKTGNPSYQPLQNAQILNTQNVTLPDGTTEPATQYIKSTYGVCFTDSMGTLLDTSPSSGPGMGTPYITRDAFGNVIDSPNAVVSGVTYNPGRCSEYYMGPNSADTTLVGAVQKTLVFRWRLEQSYIQSLNMLINIQNGNS